MFYNVIMESYVIVEFKGMYMLKCGHISLQLDFMHSVIFYGLILSVS
jgi:hypothetical protein